MTPELEQARLQRLLETISLEQAQQYLGEVHPEKKFSLFQGGALTSLNDLHDTLKEMNAEQFQFHVNENKNDFRNWIKDVIEDKRLARDIFLVKKQETMINKVRDRIDSLQYVIDKKR